jgi:Fe-S-cluster containining protein
MNPNEPTATDDTANIHLRLLGEEHVFPVPLPLGRRTLLDLLPAARELSNRATAVGVERSRGEGREISCRAGCGACCRQLVAISFVEAQSLADLVADMPPERQAFIRERFADAVRRLEADGLLDPKEPRGERSVQAPDLGDRAASLRDVSRRYFALQIACPFLENESCGIHPQRPMVCREYHVTSPAENCSRLYEIGVDRLLSPLHMGEVLARTARRTAGTEPGMIPLVLSLEWAEAHGGRLREPHDGMEMFQAMMGEIDTDYAEEFNARDEPDP